MFLISFVLKDRKLLKVIEDFYLFTFIRANVQKYNGNFVRDSPEIQTMCMGKNPRHVSGFDPQRCDWHVRGLNSK